MEVNKYEGVEAFICIFNRRIGRFSYCYTLGDTNKPWHDIGGSMYNTLEDASIERSEGFICLKILAPEASHIVIPVLNTWMRVRWPNEIGDWTYHKMYRMWAEDENAYFTFMPEEERCRSLAG